MNNKYGVVFIRICQDFSCLGNWIFLNFVLILLEEL